MDLSLFQTTLFSDVTDWVAEEEGWPSTYVVHSSLNAFASICTTSEYNHSFELLWVLVGSIFIGALYHPPRALYTTDTLLSYTESCIIEIATLLLSATIILAGDFNQLSDDDCTVHRTDIDCHSANSSRQSPRSCICILLVYQTVRVVKSLVCSDHNAVVAYTDRLQAPKIVAQKTYHCISPSQHASFLLGLLRFYYSISGSVLAGFSQKTAVSVFSQFRFLHEIWVKQTINYKRNNVIRERVHLYVRRQS